MAHDHGVVLDLQVSTRAPFRDYVWADTIKYERNSGINCKSRNERGGKQKRKRERERERERRKKRRNKTQCEKRRSRKKRLKAFEKKKKEEERKTSSSDNALSSVNVSRGIITLFVTRARRRKPACDRVEKSNLRDCRGSRVQAAWVSTCRR